MPSRDFLHFTAQKSKCPPRFWDKRPWNFAHVCNVPLPSLRRIGFFLFFFVSLEMWNPLTPKYLQKYKNKNKSGKKKTNENENPIRTSRGTLNTCAKFQGLMSQKRRGHLDSEGIWGFMLEPAWVFSIKASPENKHCAPRYSVGPGVWCMTDGIEPDSCCRKSVLMIKDWTPAQRHKQNCTPWA